MIDNLSRNRPFLISLALGVAVGLSTYAIFSTGILALLIACMGATGFLVGEATTRLLGSINHKVRQGWVVGLICGVAYVLVERLPEQPTANLALAALFIIFPVVLRRWITVRQIVSIAKWIAPRSRSAIEAAASRFRWDEDEA